MRPQPSDAVPCANADEGCTRPARGRRHKYCDACHAENQRRAQGIQAVPSRGQRYATPFERVFAAAVDLAAASSEDDADYERRRARLRGAFQASVKRALREHLARLRTQDDIAALLAKLGPHEGAANSVPAGPDTAQRGSEQRPSSEETAGPALPEGPVR